MSDFVNTLESFLRNPPFLSEDIRKLWESVASFEDSFDSRGKVKKIRFAKHVRLPLLDSKKTYLPIEFLRGTESSQLFQGSSVDRFFLSSGTTAETRSVSNFSHDGLLLYKAQSLKVFHDVMRRFFGNNSLKIQGYSLIPSSTEWTTSSLAQMLTWISEFWPVNWGHPTKPNYTSPVWIFATPFQLLDLFENNFSCPLPKGSLVFETGGTKGKTREVSREELYTLISERFQIPQENIISEYGMCELACQAYDFADSKQTRRFRFPAWVHTSVLPGLGMQKSEGEGALLIDDPLRLDYPWPLRVQDVGRLYKDGSFTLLGRVPRAVLKGCSLFTENLRVIPKELLNRDASTRASQISNQIPKLYSVKDILDESCLEALSTELGSLEAAVSACEDLRLSFSEMQEQTSLKNSQAQKGEHWLLILPNNHSIAGVYPLVLGTLAGLRMTVRIPSAFEKANSFLQIFLDKLTPYADITRLPSDFRLGQDPFPEDVDKLFIFGDNETIREVQKLSPVPVSGFGTGITVNAVHSLSSSFASLLAKDFLSLGQRGCMSSRALFVCGKWEELTQFLHGLEKECSRFWESEFSTMQKVAIDHETLALQRRGFEIFKRSSLNDVLFPIFRMDRGSEEPSHLLSSHPFVFPILFYGREKEKMHEHLSRFPSLICVSTDSLSETFPKSIRVCKLGKGNSPSWDGLQNSKPLFA